MGYSSTKGIVPRSVDRHSRHHRLGKSLSTRCVVTIGILLPIVGAIIGVVAWAVGNEAVHSVSSERRGSSRTIFDSIPLRLRNDLFEERNDHLLNEKQKVSIGSAVSTDGLGSKLTLESEEGQNYAKDGSRDLLQGLDYRPPATTEPMKDDPLYVVHYVPQMKPEVTSPKTVESPVDNSDILSKIMSASKASGQKTPQFVVFAPMPGEGGFQNFAEETKQAPEYEDYEEHQQRPVSKRNRLKKRRKHRKNLRIMDSEDEDEPMQEEEDHIARVPYGQRYPQSEVVSRERLDNQRTADILKPIRNAQPFDVLESQRQQQLQQQQQQQFRQQQQQQYPPQATVPRYPQKGCCEPQSSSHNESPRFPPTLPGYEVPQHLPAREPDADRYGQVVPQGITVTLGNGLPFSPLGLLRQILRPLNPTFDLKKKLFFGVQLENGFGLGGRGGKGGSERPKSIDLTIG